MCTMRVPGDFIITLDLESGIIFKKLYNKIIKPLSDKKSKRYRRCSSLERDYYFIT